MLGNGWPDDLAFQLALPVSIMLRLHACLTTALLLITLYGAMIIEGQATASIDYCRISVSYVTSMMYSAVALAIMTFATTS